MLLWAWASFTPNSPLFGRVVDGARHERPRARADVRRRAVGRDGRRACSTRCATRERARDVLRARPPRRGAPRARPPDQRGGPRDRVARLRPRAAHVRRRRRTSTRQLERTERLARRRARRGSRSPRSSAPRTASATRSCARATSRRGYRVVGWTKGVWDTAKPGVETIVRRTIGGFRPGGDPAAARRRRQRRGRRPQPDRRGRARDRRARARRRLRARDRLRARRRARPRKRTAPWRIVAGLVLFGVLLELGAAHASNISTVDAVDIAWWWVVVALLANLVSILLKAVVWKAALDTIPDHPTLPLRARRAGALRRLPAQHAAAGAPRRDRPRRGAAPAPAASTGIEVPNATLAGSVVAEQIVLAIALVAIMVLQLPFVNVPARFEHMILAFGGVIIVVLLAVIGLEAFSRRGGSRRSRADLALARGQQAARHALRHRCAACTRARRVLRRPRTALVALLAGLASWAAQIGGIYAALAAADIHPTIGARGPRLPRLDARAAVPVLAGQHRPLPGRRRAGARAGLPDRLPATRSRSRSACR